MWVSVSGEVTAVAVTVDVRSNERTVMATKKNAPKKALTPERTCPVLIASKTVGAISSRRNAAGDAWTVAFQMLIGSPTDCSFDEEESINEITPSGAQVVTKRKTGKTVEWQEHGVLIVDDYIEVGGELYRVTFSRRRLPKDMGGGMRPAIVIKPVNTPENEETVATEGTVF